MLGSIGYCNLYDLQRWVGSCTCTSICLMAQDHLDENLFCLLGEERTYPPDVVEKKWINPVWFILHNFRGIHTFLTWKSVKVLVGDTFRRNSSSFLLRYTYIHLFVFHLEERCVILCAQEQEMLILPRWSCVSSGRWRAYGQQTTNPNAASAT